MPGQSASELIGPLRGQGLLCHLLDVGRLVHFMLFLLLTKYLKFCHRQENQPHQTVFCPDESVLQITKLRLRGSLYFPQTPHHTQSQSSSSMRFRLEAH